MFKSKFKSILSLLIVLCLCLTTFCACGNNVSSDNEEDESVSPVGSNNDENITDTTENSDSNVIEEEKEPEIKLPSADDALNGLGNTYLSDGYAVTDGEWIYYRSYDSADDSYGMKRMSMDGEAVETLPGGNLWWIDLEDGFLYGSYKKRNIVKVDIANRDEYKYNRCQDLNEYNSYYITVDNGWIYYCTNDTRIDKNGVYKMKTDGTENTLLYEGVCSQLKLDGEWLYFHHDAHYKIKLDGTGLEKIAIDDFAFIVSDGEIFDYKGSHASMINEVIYYNGKDGIYKVNADGNGETKILDGEDYSHVQATGDWLFFCDKETNIWYFCKTDGSGLKIAP